MDDAFVRELRDREPLYRELFEDAPVPLVLVDPGPGTVVDANRAAGKLLGEPRDRLVGERLAELESRLRDEAREVEIPAAMVTLSGRGYRLCALVEGGSRGQAERPLHDSLTGLPGRELLYDRLGVALARMPRRESVAAVLLMDLDRFASVNDNYGRQAGDGLLVAVARRLEGSLRPADTVSRFGGDRFVILCEDLAGQEAAMTAAWRVTQSLARPFILDQGEVFVSASVGVAVAAATRQRPDDLIRGADAAMCRAKELGGDRVVVFEPSMEGVPGRLGREG